MLGINDSTVTAVPVDVWVSSNVSITPELTVRTTRGGSLRATRKKRLNLNPGANSTVPRVAHLSLATPETRAGRLFAFYGDGTPLYETMAWRLFHEQSTLKEKVRGKKCMTLLLSWWEMK